MELAPAAGGSLSSTRQLAKLLAGAPQGVATRPDPPVTLTRGTITAVGVPAADGSSVTMIQLAGSAKSVEADLLVGYNAQAGDDVEVLISAPRVVVLGPSNVVNSPIPEGVPYTLSGALSVSTSPPVTPRESLAVTGFSATLGTAGTSSTDVELHKNGNRIAGVTLASGDTYAFTTFPAVTIVGRQDEYTVAVITAGTGAADLGGEIEIN